MLNDEKYGMDEKTWDKINSLFDGFKFVSIRLSEYNCDKDIYYYSSIEDLAKWENGNNIIIFELYAKEKKLLRVECNQTGTDHRTTNFNELKFDHKKETYSLCDDELTARACEIMQIDINNVLEEDINTIDDISGVICSPDAYEVASASELIFYFDEDKE